jgi:hypothetical protein
MSAPESERKNEEATLEEFDVTDQVRPMDMHEHLPALSPVNLKLQGEDIEAMFRLLQYAHGQLLDAVKNQQLGADIRKAAYHLCKDSETLYAVLMDQLKLRRPEAVELH